MRQRRAFVTGGPRLMLTTISDDAETVTIARACTGDSLAFSHLVAAYQTPIYNLCYRMLGNTHDAEEAAQETFLRAYTRLSSYDLIFAQAATVSILRRPSAG